MEEANTSPKQLLGIGQRLREARESRRLTLHIVSQRLKIRMHYLVALEEENFEELPGGAYVLGFLKNYSYFLGLDAEELKQMYLSRYGEERLNGAVAINKRKRNFSEFVLTPTKVIIAFLFIISAMVLWYLISAYSNLTKAPELEILTPQNDVTYTSSKIRIVGRTNPDAVLTIEGEDVLLSTDGDFDTEYVVVESGLVTLRIEAKNRANSESTVKTLAFNVDLPETILSTPIEENTAIDGVQIDIRVTEEVWFGVTIDGEESQFILDAGQSETIMAKDEITIQTGKAYATYISFNGSEEEIFGLGDVLKRTWNIDGESL